VSTTGSNTVTVQVNRPGLCVVQSVVGQALAKARQTLSRAHCRVGKIRRVPVRSVKGRGRVISQKPKFGAVRRGGAKVNLVISGGRRPS
jgi:beta-lactam-binding protein with PASTA domain